MTDTIIEPAFPVISDILGHCHGMSLHDYYAGKAMQGILAGNFYNPGQADQIAKDSKAIADAMISARETK